MNRVNLLLTIAVFLPCCCLQLVSGSAGCESEGGALTIVHASVDNELHRIVLEGEERNLQDLVEHIQYQIVTDRDFSPWYATITRKSDSRGEVRVKFYFKGVGRDEHDEIKSFLLKDDDFIYFGSVVP